MQHPNPLRIYFVRHGQTEHFEEPPFNGWLDAPLTSYGREQLDQVAEALSPIPFDAIYSSDLQRAVYGGEKLSATTKVPLVSDKMWREINFGRWEGWTYKQIVGDDKNLIKKIFSPEGFDTPFPDGGESCHEFAQRIKLAFEDLKSKHPSGGRVALVAHGGVCKALWGMMFNLPGASAWHIIRQDFAAVNVADCYPTDCYMARLVNGYVGPEGYFQSGPGFERILGKDIFGGA